MLELINISKTFAPGTLDEKLALNKLSLKVNDGDFITIIGANGAGKSTLFNSICGSFFTDEGNIVLDGEDITLTPQHIRSRQIGRLFQDPMLGTASGMSIEENMALAVSSSGWLKPLGRKDKKLIIEKIKELDMGLEDRMNTIVGTLSGGQRQALTLLMATMSSPKLLLLDEHTAALDPATASKVIELTNKIVSENKLTCLMITHNMQQALELGNRTIMMDQGKIIYDVSGEERSKLTVEDLLVKFKELSGNKLDNDRMLLL